MINSPLAFNSLFKYYIFMAKAKSTTPKKTVAVKKTPARPARSSVKKTAVAAKTVKVEQTESVKTPISTKKNFLILGALIIAIIAVLLYQNKDYEFLDLVTLFIR